MSPTLGGRRSPDAWSSPHDRARARLAERMTEPIDPEESAWLEAHLVGCDACREIDAAYQSDRASLRAMRAAPPPRDLWARTSAALDVEQGRAAGGRRSRPARPRSSTSVLAFPRGRLAPVGAFGSIAAVLVVGFLVGNAIIGGSAAGSPSQGVALGASATPNLVPTPITVPGGDVAWVSTDSDGSIVLKQAQVTGVCPPDKTSDCTAIGPDASNVATLSVKPKSVHQSPTSGQMIVFGTGQGAGSGLTIYVINTGKGATPTPAATATTPPTPAPTASTAVSSPSSGGPSPSDGTTTPPSTAPTATPVTTASPTPKATSTASIVPNVTPPPSAATLIAIASDLGVLNAETAAYSADGAWFAFTARSLGDPTGSDIYLWHAGDAQAKQVTKDGRSVFAGWIGDRLIGSRATPTTTLDGTPSAAAATEAAVSQGSELGVASFIVDPSSLTKTAIPTAAWRPAVDPTGKYVVYWDGTVAVDPDTGGWRSATGRLVIRSWPIVAGTAPASSAAPSQAPASATPSPSTSPSASASAGSSAAASPSASPKATKKPAGSPVASPSASVAPSPSSSPSVPASPSPSPVAPSGLPASIASASGVDWAVAWDENGTHLALWVGDSGDRSFGRLSLLTIGANGQAATSSALPNARPALPGFALGDGHLAWATPPGVNAEGSKLTVFDYSGPDSGESSGVGQPGADTVIVVQH